MCIGWCTDQVSRSTSDVMFCYRPRKVVIVSVEGVLSLDFVLAFVVILVFWYRLLGVYRKG